MEPYVENSYVIFECEYCQVKLRIPGKVEVKKGCCPKCRKWITIPSVREGAEHKKKKVKKM